MIPGGVHAGNQLNNGMNFRVVFVQNQPSMSRRTMLKKPWILSVETYLGFSTYASDDAL
jgi:hypothetical protein